MVQLAAKIGATASPQVAAQIFAAALSQLPGEILAAAPFLVLSDALVAHCAHGAALPAASALAAQLRYASLPGTVRRLLHAFSMPWTWQHCLWAL